MTRYLLLLLLLAAPAFAQTTTTTTLPATCTDATASELDAALAANPTAQGPWVALTAYATRRHFDTSHYADVMKCVDDSGNVAYIATFTNLRVGSPPAGLRYLPSSDNTVEQVALTYQKSPRTIIEIVGSGTGTRATVNRDGSFKSFRLLDGAGHTLHIPKTPAPTARRRHLDVRPQVAAIGDAECAAVLTAKEACDANEWSKLTTEQKAAKQVLKADRAWSWGECALTRNRVQCARTAAVEWAERVLDPCRQDTSCIQPEGCLKGGCTKTWFSRTARCQWDVRFPRSVCDDCPESCDRQLCVCMDTTTTTTTTTTSTTSTTCDPAQCSTWNEIGAGCFCSAAPGRCDLCGTPCLGPIGSNPGCPTNEGRTWIYDPCLTALAQQTCTPGVDCCWACRGILPGRVLCP
jgi:hypothetical protein